MAKIYTYRFEAEQQTCWEIFLRKLSSGWPAFFFSAGALQSRPSEEPSISPSSRVTRHTIETKTYSDITVMASKVIEEEVVPVPVAILEFKRTIGLSYLDLEAALSQVLFNARARVFQGEVEDRLPSAYHPGKNAKHRPLLALSICGNRCRRIFFVNKDIAYVDTAQRNLEERCLDGVLPSCAELDWTIVLGRVNTEKLDHILLLANRYCEYIENVDASGSLWHNIYEPPHLDPYMSSLPNTGEPSGEFFKKVDMSSVENRNEIAKHLKRKRGDQVPPSTQAPARRDGDGAEAYPPELDPRNKEYFSPSLVPVEQRKILSSMTIRPVQEMHDEHRRLFLHFLGDDEWRSVAQIVFPSN